MADPSKYLKRIRIFIASPGDLIPERSSFREIVEEVNRIKAKSKDILLEPIGWEDTLPGRGRPQELINEDLKQCDLIIMLLWMRWGSPSGKYSSGFEEEYELAIREGKEIFFYFRDVPDEMLVAPDDQLKEVLNFRDKIEKEKILIYKRYSNEEDWKNILRDNLCRWLDGLPIGTIEIARFCEYPQQIQELETKLAEVRTEQAKAALHMAADAELFANSGQITRAEESFAKAVAISPAPQIINSYGVFLYRIGSLQKAEKTLLRLLGIGQSADDGDIIAAACGNLGNIYLVRGELDKAEEMYKKSLAIAEKLGSKKSIAISYGNLGHIYNDHGDFINAEEMYKKSLNIELELGRKEGLADQYRNLGCIYLKYGDLEKAEEYHAKSLALEEELGGKRGLALQYGNLCLIYTLRDDRYKAKEFFQKAQDLFTEMTDKDGLASLYCSLAVVFQLRGNLDESTKMYKKSIPLLTELGNELKATKIQSLLEELKQTKSGKSKSKRKSADTKPRN